MLREGWGGRQTRALCYKARDHLLLSLVICDDDFETKESILGAREACGAREEGALPRAGSRAHIFFPFPFERG